MSSSSDDDVPDELQPDADEEEQKAGELEPLFHSYIHDPSKNVHARNLSLLCRDRDQNKEWPAGDWKYFLPEVIAELMRTGLKCPYCTCPITAHNFSLDRVDNGVHHTASNCIITCGACNVTRSDKYTTQEFVAVCKFLRTVRENAGTDVPALLSPAPLSLRALVEASNNLRAVKTAAASKKLAGRVECIMRKLSKHIISEAVNSSRSHRRNDSAKDHRDFMESTLDEYDTLRSGGKVAALQSLEHFAPRSFNIDDYEFTDELISELADKYSSRKC